MDLYATHQAVLVSAVMRTTGPVMELGAGHCSTPILHEICAAQGRKLLTCEFNFDWLKQFAHLATPSHVIHHVPDWANYKPIDRKNAWDVVFVDHSPGERRKTEIERLRLRLAGAGYIVVHDTEPNPVAMYGLEPVFAKFKHRRNFSTMEPWTTVVSDKYEIW